MTVRILAGAPALDRRLFPRPGSVARWFEPFHVRQPQVARGEISAQVVAGADMVVAPAWLTHRRALEAVGESRRARAWTTAAVRLARDAADDGLERREGKARPVVVAGPLPDIAAGPELATGRLLPASASEERDTHDQAGILADADVDLLLLEARPSLEATIVAGRVAVSAGRPVWAVVPVADGPGEPPLPERVAMLEAIGIAGILIQLPTTERSGLTDVLASVVSGAATPIGLLADVPPVVTDIDLDAWLGAGLQVMGLGSGADPDAIRPIVDARERLLSATRERHDAERTSLASWVQESTDRAPGGRALWLGPRSVPVPGGFDWIVLDGSDTTAVAALPEQAFRLVIDLSGAAPDRLVRLVEQGGIVAIEAFDDDPDRLGRLRAVGLRVQQVGAAPDGRSRLICRREGA
jgi:hypothetical protein